MGTIKPRKRPSSEFKHITTLLGLSEQEQADFAWNDIKRFFRVSLYDRSNICAGCREAIDSLEEASLDHIVPRSKGGRTRLVNLQLMHPRCNSKKTNTMPAHYSTKAFTPIDSNRGSVTKYMIKRGIVPHQPLNREQL